MSLVMVFSHRGDRALTLSAQNCMDAERRGCVYISGCVKLGIKSYCVKREQLILVLL